MQNNKKNKTSLRSFNMKQATSQIFHTNSVVTSLAGNSLNKTFNLTMSFPSCPTENLLCGGPAYIPKNSATMQMQIYVDKTSLNDVIKNITTLESLDVIKNKITKLKFSFDKKNTFDIRYNKSDSQGNDNAWDVFDIIKNDGILNKTLELVQSGKINIPQIISSDNNAFLILSPNVILK